MNASEEDVTAISSLNIALSHRDKAAKEGILRSELYDLFL